MAVLKNTKSRELIQEMWDHEKAHLAKFEELLVEYQVGQSDQSLLILGIIPVIKGSTNRSDPSLEACGLHTGRRMLPAWGEGGHGLHRRGNISSSF